MLKEYYIIVSDLEYTTENDIYLSPIKKYKTLNLYLSDTSIGITTFMRKSDFIKQDIISFILNKNNMNEKEIFTNRQKFLLSEEDIMYLKLLS